MTQYSRYNVIYRLQKWMDSVPGQTFLNYAYSWGASVVIAGTLFKLTHLPGANLMLFLGMGTEVVVFFLSAFDRPFDKTTDGMELPTHVRRDEEGEENEEDENIIPEGMDLENAPGQVAAVQGPVVGGGTIIVGGGQIGGSATAEDGSTETTPAVAAVGGTGSVVIGGGGPVAAGEGSGSVAVGSNGPVTIGGTSWVTEQQQVSPEMAEATGNYVDELKKLTEMLSLVNEQSKRLTRDSEEMENLNRTLTGISKVYEMQLKGASQQIGTIDQINEQTRKLAQQIEQLNRIYARMIEAMTVNMKVAAPNVGDNTNV